MESNPFAVPFSLKRNEPIKQKQYDDRWFLFKACRYYFCISKEKAPSGFISIEYPECGFGVSTSLSKKDEKQPWTVLMGYPIWL